MKYDRFFSVYKLTKALAGDPPLMRDAMAKKHRQAKGWIL